MKKIIGLFVLIASMSSLSAFAENESERLLVSCVDARTDLVDAGYLLNIYENENTGEEYAVIASQSKMGPHVLAGGNFVQRLSGMKRVYQGKDFKLSILLAPLNPPRSVHPAKLTFDTLVGGDVLKTIRANLICTDQQIIAL